MTPTTLFLTLASAALGASNPCPGDGRISFFEARDGFAAIRMLGDASYRALFVGHDFEKRAGKGPNIPAFSLDGLKLAWELVPDTIFAKGKPGSPRERLDSFYGFQTNVLRNLARQRRIDLAAIQAYDPREEARPDGSRWFRIWRAVYGKKGREHAEYFVATPQGAGVVLLSVVTARPEDEPKTVTLIDSYMATFAPVDAKTCATILAAKSEKGAPATVPAATQGRKSPRTAPRGPGPSGT